MESDGGEKVALRRDWANGGGMVVGDKCLEGIHYSVLQKATSGETLAKGFGFFVERVRHYDFVAVVDLMARVVDKVSGFVYWCYSDGTMVVEDEQ
jgi:hypothetical protein